MLFGFVQIEVPWPLGPADGRHAMRRAAGNRDGSDADTGQAAADASVTSPGGARAISHVIVLGSTHAAARRGGPRRRARPRDVAPEPEPATVITGRATVIAVDRPLGDDDAARAWLHAAGDAELDDALAVLERLLHAHRLATADPHAATVRRERLIAARVGYGSGEEVADGRWAQARELPEPAGRARAVRRRRVPDSDAQLAARLGGGLSPLASEELVLRARSDLDADRPREAALQVMVALDAAIAELGADARAAALADRVTQLRERRELTAGAAQAALGGTPSPQQREEVAATVRMIQDALRARAAARPAATG